ncbi:MULTISPECIES: MFS transporter [Amycolatopsis]|uniref:MFS transporter n=1 Tax=Amycolatopsis TaxID=1813 RepID=UPI0019680EBB|nr:MULTISPECIES: MFS transporter [Amycolatopsis]
MERHPLRWWGLAVTVLAVLVDMVDNQIVTVALPAIQRRLGAGALQWISAGYALGFALTLITGGRLGDRYGRKRLFLVGMTVFILASTGAGLAPGAGIRTGAGFAAAAVTAMAVAIGVLVLALLLTAALPRPRRGARFEPRSTARGEHGRRPSSRP